MAEGVKLGELTMMEYQEAWAKEGRYWEDVLRKVMPEALDVRHMGSTSVKGMFAKPIIDIYVLVKDFSLVETHIEELKEYGVYYSGEVIPYHREFACDNPETGNVSLHVHLLLVSNLNFYGALAFCEYMNVFPQVRDEYIDLKKKLLSTTTASTYGPAKENWVINTTKEALNWKWSLPGNLTIIQKLRKAASTYGDLVAIVDRNGARETTYAQLYTMAGQVAAKLGGMGFKKGSFITIRMDRCAEFIAAVYGIIMAGYAVIPTVPAYPETRIREIMEVSSSPLLIEEEFFRELDQYEPAQEIEIDEQSIVWMNFTSGSTGHPKGVCYSYRTVNRQIIEGQILYYTLRHVNHASSISLSFAAAAFDVYSPLYLGATVHLLPQESCKDVAQMQRYYEEHDINCGSIGAGLVRYFKHTKGLERIFATGQRLCNVYSDEHEIYCVYGTTESFSSVAYFKVDHEYDNTPIGKAFGHVDIRVLDDNNCEVGQGEEGEVTLTGYLSEGYFQMPEATEKVFTRLEDGRMQYRTGDVGIVNEDGNVVIVNRKDWMVKISGQRVDPAECERVLRAVDGVDDAIVKAFQDENGDYFLAAYYLGSESVSRDTLRDAVLRELPPYMLPLFFVHMDEFPMTVSGKYDRTKLEDPRQTYRSENYEGAATQLEQRVCDAMMKVLELGSLGRNDDFFEVGGNSVKTVALQCELDDDRLTIQDIVAGRTPCAIAAILEEKEKAQAAASLAGEEKVQAAATSLEGKEKVQAATTSDTTGASRVFGLTPYQKHYYEYWRFSPDVPMASTASVYRFDASACDAARLADILEAFLHAHPVYSTLLFEDGRGEVRTLLCPEMLSRPQVQKASEGEIADLKAAFVRPFDLLGHPLYRTALYQTEAAVYLFYDAHHIITDGGSQVILERELLKGINGEMPKEDGYEAYLFEQTCGKDDLTAVQADGYDIHPVFDHSATSCLSDTVVKELDSSYEELGVKLAERNISHSQALLYATLMAEAEYNGSKKVMASILYNGRDTIEQKHMCGQMAYPVSVMIDLERSGGTQEVLEEIKWQLRGLVRVKPDVNKKAIEGDVITVNYIPVKSDKGPSKAEQGMEKWDLFMNNKYHTNAFYVICNRRTGNRVEFKYNADAYERGSIERYAQLFMKYLHTLN